MKWDQCKKAFSNDFCFSCSLIFVWHTFLLVLYPQGPPCLWNSSPAPHTWYPSMSTHPRLCSVWRIGGWFVIYSIVLCTIMQLLYNNSYNTKIGIILLFLLWLFSIEMFLSCLFFISCFISHISDPTTCGFFTPTGWCTADGPWQGWWRSHLCSIGECVVLCLVCCDLCKHVSKLGESVYFGWISPL